MPALCLPELVLADRNSCVALVMCGIILVQ